MKHPSIKAAKSLNGTKMGKRKFYEYLRTIAQLLKVANSFEPSSNNLPHYSYTVSFTTKRGTATFTAEELEALQQGEELKTPLPANKGKVKVNITKNETKKD